MRVAFCAVAVISFAVCALSGCLPGEAQHEPLPPDQQVAAAVKALPEDLREGASVLGYSPDGQLVTLRDGSNDMICLADNPNDDQFHVACYHESLEPFMVRGRELRAEGKDRDELQAIRLAEIEAGTLMMPSEPTALYSLTGPVDSYDPETGAISNARPLYVVYVPYATPQSTGLSPTPAPGIPWLMDAGKPWAHIMISPDQAEATH